MQVAVIIEVFDEYVDADHESGLTEEGHDCLLGLPGEIVDIRPMEGV